MIARSAPNGTLAACLTQLLFAMLETAPLERSYKGYTISGGAARVYGHDMVWQAAARVWVRCPDNVSIEVERFYDPLLTYEDDSVGRATSIYHRVLANIGLRDLNPGRGIERSEWLQARAGGIVDSSG